MYKVGDKVKIIKNNGHEKFNKYVGNVYIIANIDSSGFYKLILPDDKDSCWEANELTLYINPIKLGI